MSGIAARSRPVGDDAPESPSVVRSDAVDGVDDRRQAKPEQCAAETAGSLELSEERDASAPVAGNGCAVSKDEPPAVVALLHRNRRQQLRGGVVLEREQREVPAPVDPGDEPRRPTAEPSAPGIEEHRPPKGRVYGSGSTLGHGARLCHGLRL
jgi:hypothetical protein